jgi:hypothetical protein
MHGMSKCKIVNAQYARILCNSKNTKEKLCQVLNLVYKLPEDGTDMPNMQQW